ncbi:hypothetical protein Tco_1492410 [Tanacetum coccineum]
MKKVRPPIVKSRYARRESFMKFFKDEEDPNHLIGECPKPPSSKNQRAFVGGTWSDSGKDEEQKTKDENCLVAQASNEICLGINLEPEEWIKDSGCSKHMMGNRKLFSTYKSYNGEDSKPMKTPMSMETKLTKDEEGESVDNTKYRGMIGSLLYLTASRPDIMFSACLCARFQEDPKTSSVKWVNVSSDTLKALHTWDYGILRGPT